MNNAYLYVDGLKLPVKYLDYNFRQFKGTNNKPKGKVHGGEFSFTLDIDNKEAITLIEWMLSTTTQKNGYIEVQDFTLSSIAFKLEFANAYATAQNFRYDAYSNLPLQTNVTVTAGALRFNREVTFLQTWNPNDPFSTQTAPILQEKEEKEPKFIMDWWSRDEAGNDKIQNANLGDTVYFHTQTKDIDCGEELTAALREYDHILGIDPLNPDDKKFPDHEINKQAFVSDKNGLEVATFRLELKENWEALITQDTGDQIELYWKVKYKNIEKELPASRNDVLYVSYSKRTLFIKTPTPNHNLPEFISYQGDPMLLMQFGNDFTKNKIEEKALGYATKKAEQQIKKIAFAKMEKGYMVDNHGKVYTGERRIYEYKKMYSNSGELFEDIKRGKDFGYKHAGKSLHTTKGISQYDYFSKNGKRVKLLGLAKSLGSVFDIFNLVKTVGEDLDTSNPLPLDFGPLSPIADLAGVLVQEQKAKMDTWLEETVQMEIDLAKLEGLDATRKAINSWNHNDEYKWELMPISNEAANKLVQGEFKTFEGLESFDFHPYSNIEVLYRKIKNTNSEKFIYVIETIFINE